MRDWLEFTDEGLASSRGMHRSTRTSKRKYEYRTTMRRLGDPSDVNEKVFRDTIIFSSSKAIEYGLTLNIKTKSVVILDSTRRRK